jgi:hypothetical protein
VASEELPNWYELVTGPDLGQGDVFDDCPIIRMPTELAYPTEDGTQLDAEVECQDVILLTQSCDLVAGQKGGMAFVTLCPLWSLSEVSAHNSVMGSSYGREMCRRGNMAGFHMLASCDIPNHKREIGVVSFRESVSLPINFLRSFAEQTGERRRLRSPYREHLAQAFARYYMRVGLPVDIPAFGTPEDERRAIHRLEALDPESRQRVIQAVGEG